MAACALRSPALSTLESAATISSHNGQQFCACSRANVSTKSWNCVVGSRKLGNGAGVGKKELLGRGLHLRVTLPHSSSIAEVQRPGGLTVEAAKRVQSGRGYVLSSTLVVEEGKEAEATALCKGIIEWAEQKKKEKGSGLVVFECNVDLFEKNTFHFWERYEGVQFMNELRASPEHFKFVNNVRPLLVKPIGLAAYEYRDGQIGHVMNPIGPKGEGGLDDATGQAGTKQQSSAIQQGLGELEEDMGSKAWGLDKLLAKIRGEDKDNDKDKKGKWSIKKLFGESGDGEL